MRFTVDQKELSTAVQNVQRAVSTKTNMPALEGILLEASGSSLTLSAYDLELGMQTDIPAKIQEEGATILQARLFSEIVRRAPGETVTITSDNKNIISIESGKSVTTIVGINAEEFTEFPTINSSMTPITLDGELIKSMIRQTIFAVADTDAKPIHQGSLFNAKGGILDVVSVDGFRLAVRREKISSDINMSFVVPKKTLNEVLKLTTDGKVEIYPDKRNIMFRINNYTLVSSLLEGEFLDYEAAIPKRCETTLTVKTRDFIDSVERVSLIISDRLKSPVRCLFGSDQVKLTSTTAIGRSFDSFEAKLEGNELEIGFNNKYLLDALRNTECDEITLRMNDSLKPLVINPKDSDSFIFIVLPVRLRN